MGAMKRIFHEERQLSLFEEITPPPPLRVPDNAYIILVLAENVINTANGVDTSQAFDQWLVFHGSEEEVQKEISRLSNEVSTVLKVRDFWQVGEDYKFFPREELIDLYYQLKGLKK